MAIDFSKFKKQSQSNDAFKKLNEEIDKMKKGGQFAKDEREWQPSVDAAGNGFAVIRFCPAPPPEEIPFKRIFKHAFQGPGGLWYIENSLTTIGEVDPVGELNTKLWNTGTEANKNLARDRKRKLQFVANIFVVKDSKKPECEGKNFLFKFGKKIYDKVENAAHPANEEIEAFDPFNLWKGANFNLVIKNVKSGNKSFRNYDDSNFGPSGTPLFKDDSKIEAVWKSLYPLLPFVAADQFKSYAELKAKLDRVLGTVTVNSAPQSAPASGASEAPAGTEGDGEDASYFAQLAEQD
jgi:hypothetical protein